LEHDSALQLQFDVPARLPQLLDDGLVDAALVPVIDCVRRDRNWRVLSDGCIGCDGETLTVRVFSRVPASRLSRLHVDGDSHTSVALADIVWREVYGRRLEILPYTGPEGQEDCEAILLIGDKVVQHRLFGFEIETDLGQAWKSLTGLPFVFAVWAAGSVLNDEAGLAKRLSAARDAGVRSADMIAADFGPGMGWPVNLARRYLGTRLKFTLGPRQRQGMAKFFELASRHGIVPAGREAVLT
jgi:chorismate dehydratase